MHRHPNSHYHTSSSYLLLAWPVSGFRCRKPSFLHGLLKNSQVHVLGVLDGRTSTFWKENATELVHLDFARLSVVGEIRNVHQTSKVYDCWQHEEDWAIGLQARSVVLTDVLQSLSSTEKQHLCQPFCLKDFYLLSGKFLCVTIWVSRCLSQIWRNTQHVWRNKGPYQKKAFFPFLSLRNGKFVFTNIFFLDKLRAK